MEHAAICRERGRCHNSFYSFITASRGEWGVSQLNCVFPRRSLPGWMCVFSHSRREWQPPDTGEWHHEHAETSRGDSRSVSANRTLQVWDIDISCCAKVCSKLADYLAIHPWLNWKVCVRNYALLNWLSWFFSPSSLFSGNRISFLEEKTFRNKLVDLKYLWVELSEMIGTNSETENFGTFNLFMETFRLVLFRDLSTNILFDIRGMPFRNLVSLEYL